MDVGEARAVLNHYKQQAFAELREAIDCLMARYGNYRAIGEQVEPSATTISKYHKITQLPGGILWQLEQDNLPLGMAYQVSRLSCERDQWLLAFFVVDLRDDSFSVRDCRDVVTRVLDSQLSARQALEQLTGEAFDRTQALVLPVDFDFRFRLAKASWERHSEWQDLCYAVIDEWLNKQDTLKEAEDLSSLLARIDSVVKDLKSWDV